MGTAAGKLGVVIGTVSEPMASPDVIYDIKERIHRTPHVVGSAVPTPTRLNQANEQRVMTLRNGTVVRLQTKQKDGTKGINLYKRSLRSIPRELFNHPLMDEVEWLNLACNALVYHKNGFYKNIDKVAKVHGDSDDEVDSEGELVEHVTFREESVVSGESESSGRQSDRSGSACTPASSARSGKDASDDCHVASTEDGFEIEGSDVKASETAGEAADRSSKSSDNVQSDAKSSRSSSAKSSNPSGKKSSDGVDPGQVEEGAAGELDEESPKVETEEKADESEEPEGKVAEHPSEEESEQVEKNTEKESACDVQKSAEDSGVEQGAGEVNNVDASATATAPGDTTQDTSDKDAPTPETVIGGNDGEEIVEGGTTLEKCSTEDSNAAKKDIAESETVKETTVEEGKTVEDGDTNQNIDEGKTVVDDPVAQDDSAVEEVPEVGPAEATVTGAISSPKIKPDDMIPEDVTSETNVCADKPQEVQKEHSVEEKSGEEKVEGERVEEGKVDEAAGDGAEAKTVEKQSPVENDTNVEDFDPESAAKPPPPRSVAETVNISEFEEETGVGEDAEEEVFEEDKDTTQKQEDGDDEKRSDSKSSKPSSDSSSDSSSDKEGGEEEGGEVEEWIEVELMSDDEGEIRDREGNIVPRGRNTLPNRFDRMPNLMELHLGYYGKGNPLKTIPPTIFTLRHLRKLDASSCRLTELPPEVSCLTSLEELWLSGNFLTTLPRSLGELKKLKSLWVNYNNLTGIPPTLEHCDSLEGLYAHGNEIEFLSTALCRIPKLSYLGMGRNR